MVMSGDAGVCSKDWLVVWSPDHIPIWCFFCRVLLALHSDILLPCTLTDVSNMRRAPKPRFTFASVLMQSSGFGESGCRNRICIGFNPWVICSFMSPPCFAMVWREPSSLQIPGNLGEGELAQLQCRYPCSAGVTFRTISRKIGRNGGYISSKRQRCVHPSTWDCLHQL